ncbi:hypothetical protein EV127DRAFT_447295 [Xylaria flabelliformis]|nr:hypothetical protein EV127DRAFT_447295 [Xylaria flabelliformis]
MEIAGMALAVAGVVVAFKGAVDSALFIESFSDDENTDCSYLALNYHIQKTRLKLWGDEYVVKAGTSAQSHKLRNIPEYVQESIVRILGEIEKLNQKATDLVDKYNAKVPDLPGQVTINSMQPEHNLPKSLAILKLKPTSRFRWTIKKKGDFETIIARLRELIGDLENFTLVPEKSQLMANSLVLHILTSLNNTPELLQALGDSRVGADQSLTFSARAKSIQQDMHPGLPTNIGDDQLTLLGGSPNLGLLMRPGGKRVPVLLEWNIIQTSTGKTKHVERLEALGHLLEQVSDPSIRLPPCYGIYHDANYEVDHPGWQRVGYTFGTPSSIANTTARWYQYDSRLDIRPPTSLTTRIRNQKEIPALEDRFQLAYNLATAFGLFHAAGWLHKGFHSNNIVFFERIEDRGLDETEPFIVGFQYSRPQQAESLSSGPLSDPSLVYYYHPDVEKGFTKARDLYGLGVVMCEIGRWCLMVDISERRKRKLQSRAMWQDYLLTNVVNDLGWRMGTKYQTVVKTLLSCGLPNDDAGEEFFTQRYIEEVMKPLKACSA